MQCPHCGFDIEEVDRIFGAEDVRLKCLTDAAGVLKRRERVAVRRVLVEFQRKFPQLFFAIYFGTFKELPSLRQFGFWLLNRGAFEDVDVSRPNEAGILLSVDVSGKAAGITFGYMVQPFLDEEVTFKALSAAHPYFLQGQWLRASEVVVRKMTRTLGKQARRAKRDPEAFEPAPQPGEDGAGDILERIRAHHRGNHKRTKV